MRITPTVSRPRQIVLQFLLSSFLLLGDAFAQNHASLSGFVRDADSREALIGANVMVSGANLGAATNVEGYFVVNGIPPGTYEVTINYIGYKKQREKISFAAREKVVKNFLLAVQPIEAGGVR